jgi:hypothetical protein
MAREIAQISPLCYKSKLENTVEWLIDRMN